MLKLFTRTLKYCNVLNRSVDTKSYQKLKINLLKSQFHQNGRKHFLKSKYLLKDFDSNVAQIQKAMIDIDSRRTKVLEVLKESLLMNEQRSIQKEEQKSYYQSYLKLTELIKQSKFDDYWFYNLVGWFNIQSMFFDMIQKLVNETNKNGHLLLVEAIGWMTPNQYYLSKDLQFYQIQRQHKNIDTYYSGLNLSLPFSIVKQIQKIFDLASTYNKGRFYERYLNKNINSILDKINIKNQEQTENIFWILNIYIETLNDKKEIIQKIQNFILNNFIQLKQKHILTLINVYNKKGSINRQIYVKYIRKYLVEKKKSDIDTIVKLLKFVIYSETDDIEMINFLLKVIAGAELKNLIPRQLKLQVHYLCHYMKVKEIKYQLQNKIDQRFCQQCTNYNQNGTIARLMAIEVDQKGRKQGKQYYESNCLRKGRALEQDKEQIGEQIKKGKGGDFKRYKKIKFCILSIQNCVMNNKRKKTIILQTNYTRFEQSRKLIRELQVRHDLLTYYGFKINYVESELKRKIDPNEQQAISEDDSQDQQ